jgi:SAM-dependent methyltransferase
MNDPSRSYGDEFYERQMEGSYNSANKIVTHLATFFKSTSVVDVGCGRGPWLKALKEAGATKLLGIDGPWNTQADMIDQDIVFQQEDLNNPASIQITEQSDLAISLEVAEHLKPKSSEAFIAKLASLSDVVLFSAAYNKQGGKDHINEREHSFWAGEFATYGFQPYDLFRPVFWGDPDVRFWYQQNCFLYVKDGCAVAEKLASMGHYPLKNLDFMNCIHPRLYGRYTKPPALTRLRTKIKKRFDSGAS